MENKKNQKNEKEELTKEEKKTIEEAVKRLVKEHGDVLDKLADE